MSKSGSRWEQLRERILTDPEARQQYDRTRRILETHRSILEEIDRERERAGLSKASLAERIGVNPASIRRLFTSEGSNPTLMTVIEMLDALGLELTVRGRATVESCRSDQLNENHPRDISVA